MSLSVTLAGMERDDRGWTYVTEEESPEHGVEVVTDWPSGLDLPCISGHANEGETSFDPDVFNSRDTFLAFVDTATFVEDILRKATEFDWKNILTFLKETYDLGRYGYISGVEDEEERELIISNQLNDLQLIVSQISIFVGLYRQELSPEIANDVIKIIELGLSFPYLSIHTTETVQPFVSILQSLFFECNSYRTDECPFEDGLTHCWLMTLSILEGLISKHSTLFVSDTGSLSEDSVYSDDESTPEDEERRNKRHMLKEIKTTIQKARESKNGGSFSEKYLSFRRKKTASHRSKEGEKSLRRPSSFKAKMRLRSLCTCGISSNQVRAEQFREIQSSRSSDIEEESSLRHEERMPHSARLPRTVRTAELPGRPHSARCPLSHTSTRDRRRPVSISDSAILSQRTQLNLSEESSDTLPPTSTEFSSTRLSPRDDILASATLLAPDNIPPSGAPYEFESLPEGILDEDEHQSKEEAREDDTASNSSSAPKAGIEHCKEFDLAFFKHVDAIDNLYKSDCNYWKNLCSILRRRYPMHADRPLLPEGLAEFRVIFDPICLLIELYGEDLKDTVISEIIEIAAIGLSPRFLAIHDLDTVKPFVRLFKGLFRTRNNLNSLGESHSFERALERLYGGVLEEIGSMIENYSTPLRDQVPTMSEASPSADRVRILEAMMEALSSTWEIRIDEEAARDRLGISNSLMGYVPTSGIRRLSRFTRERGEDSLRRDWRNYQAGGEPTQTRSGATVSARIYRAVTTDNVTRPHSFRGPGGVSRSERTGSAPRITGLSQGAEAVGRSTSLIEEESGVPRVVEMSENTSIADAQLLTDANSEPTMLPTVSSATRGRENATSEQVEEVASLSSSAIAIDTFAPVRPTTVMLSDGFAIVTAADGSLFTVGEGEDLTGSFSRHVFEYHSYEEEEKGDEQASLSKEVVQDE